MKTLNGFDSDDPRFDLIKYIRQLRCVINWIWNKGRGTIEAATGFGKSSIALLILARLNKKKNTKYGKKAFIVVPTLNLKEQWIEHIEKRKWDFVEVQVINTVSLGKDFKREVDLLILDEIHGMAAEQFRNVFWNVKYCWVLGLTATVERLDGKHSLIKKVCPVVDTITQKEAIEKGWITDFTEINVNVPISREKAVEQIELNKKISKLLQNFATTGTIAYYNMLDCLNINKAHNFSILLKKSAKELQQLAFVTNSLIKKRTEFIETTKEKVDATNLIINELKKIGKTLIFSQSTTFVEEVAQSHECKTYHSNIESEERLFEKYKTYKTEKGAIKYSEKVNGEYKKVDGGYVVSYKVLKKVSGSAIAKENLRLFKTNEINLLLSAKALDQGYDDNTILFGVEASRSKSTTQRIQRTGRISRILLNEHGEHTPKFYFNLVIPNYCIPYSKDQQKLKESQEKSADVQEMEIDEVLDLIKTISKTKINTCSSQ